MRTTSVFPIDDNLHTWKKRLLHWAAGCDVAIYLDSNEHANGHPVPQSHKMAAEGWQCLAAAGAAAMLETNTGQAFSRLEQFRRDINNDWHFGFFSYDLKNETERLSSGHPDGIGLPDLGFFRPETVAGIRHGRLEIHTLHHSPEEIFREIAHAGHPENADSVSQAVTSSLRLTTAGTDVRLHPRMPKPDYLQTVEAIRQHIIEGDVYEMNLCQEFFAENAVIEPVSVFEKLNAIGQSPFATFLRWRDRYLLSASPERFLKKEGRRLISQPIKGTRRRGKNAAEDELIRQELAASEKDRAENVMIVDLVRNDLARNCLPGSVRVDELFGIYTFQTVHQMISTVSGTLKDEGIELLKEKSPVSLSALRDAFPPGSMTGAPKVMAMELIERYERSRRGLYSGAVGYFDPSGNFDFNVVIRSILYNAADKYISVQVGGAIVFDSEAEKEYEECLVKAEAMVRALGGNTDRTDQTD